LKDAATVYVSTVPKQKERPVPAHVKTNHDESESISERRGFTQTPHQCMSCADGELRKF